MAGNCVFVFGGQVIANKLSNNESLLSWIIGGIFALTALIQVYKMATKKDVEHRIDHPGDETKQFEGQVDDINREGSN
jgi:hypothetical protein